MTPEQVLALHRLLADLYGQLEHARQRIAELEEQTADLPDRRAGDT